MRKNVLFLALGILCLVFFVPAVRAQSAPPAGPPEPVLAEDGALHGLGLLPEPPEGLAKFVPVVPTPNLAESVVLPLSVDNSSGLPPIGDQGQQNSCVGFAFGYYAKTYAEAKEHGWSQFDSSHQYSPAYIYNQARMVPDAGMYYSDAMTLMQELGACSLAKMPYNQNINDTWPFEAAYQEALKYRIGNGYAVDITLTGSLDAIKQHLASGKIGVLGIWVYDNFRYIGNFNNIYCMAQKTGANSGGHAATVVGYDDSMVTCDGLGAFKVANSWGTSWGSGGYYWISYQAVTDLAHTLTQGYFYYFDEIANDNPAYAMKFTIYHQRFRSLDLLIGTGSGTSPTTHAHLFDLLSYAYDRSPSIAAPTWPIWVDVTPIWPIPYNTNTFLSARNIDTTNLANGQIQTFTLVRLSDNTAVNSTSVPVNIPYNGTLVHADIAWPWQTLTVTASASPTSGAAPLNVNFTGAASNGAAPYTFTWSFGDGSTSSQQNPTHQYGSNGTYTVTLLAQDVAGRTGYAAPITITVTNIQPPTVTSMAKKGNPFKILVYGGNLQSGIRVYINNTLWTNVVWIGPTQVQLKGGGALKALVPKNTLTQFHFVNPDGGTCDKSWGWP